MKSHPNKILRLKGLALAALIAIGCCGCSLHYGEAFNELLQKAQTSRARGTNEWTLEKVVIGFTNKDNVKRTVQVRGVLDKNSELSRALSIVLPAGIPKTRQWLAYNLYLLAATTHYLNSGETVADLRILEDSGPVTTDRSWFPLGPSEETLIRLTPLAIKTKDQVFEVEKNTTVPDETWLPFTADSLRAFWGVLSKRFGSLDSLLASTL